MPVLGDPDKPLVCGSVVWYEKNPVTNAEGAIRQFFRLVLPVLMMVTKALAKFPAWTERLAGRIDATRGLGPVGATGARRPILFPSYSVNQMALSEPTAIPLGKLAGVVTGNSLIAPAVVIRPMLLPSPSVNQSAPSGP